MKSIVVVADNPLIVAAIRAGVRASATLQLLGYVDALRATAEQIAGAGANVVLVDEAEGLTATLALIRALKERDRNINVTLLALALEGEWVRGALEAGANGVILKSVHPLALATLIRETLAGHIFHAPGLARPARTAPVARAGDHASLTDREREILQLVSSGATNCGIAQELWITQQTVKFHVSNIYRKLGVANRTEACHYAHVNGIAPALETDTLDRQTALATAS